MFDFLSLNSDLFSLQQILDTELQDWLLLMSLKPYF